MREILPRLPPSIRGRGAVRIERPQAAAAPAGGEMAGIAVSEATVTAQGIWRVIAKAEVQHSQTRGLVSWQRPGDGRPVGSLMYANNEVEMFKRVRSLNWRNEDPDHEPCYDFRRPTMAAGSSIAVAMVSIGAHPTTPHCRG